MYALTILIINLLIPGTPLSEKIEATYSKDNSACPNYWELSYQHPYLALADSLWEMEQFQKALGLYQLATKKFEQQKNWKGLVKAGNLTSDILRTANHYDSALSILNRNFQIITDYLDGDSVELGEVYFIKGVNYDWQKKYDRALEAYNQSLEIRLRLFGEIHIDVALTYSAIGEMYLYRQQFLNAKQYLTRAVDIIEQLNCSSLSRTGNTYYYLASAYRSLADSDKAGVYGLKALALQQNNSLNDQTRCYNLLGNLQLDMRNYEESNNYNFKAINLLQHQQPLSNVQKRDLANYLNSVASNYTENKRYDSAHIYYLKSLKIYNALVGVDDAISLIYQNIGINFTRQNQFDSGYYYLIKSVKLRRHIFGEKNFHTSSSLKSIGDFFEAKGNLDSSLVYFQRAIVAGSGDDFADLQFDANPTSESFTYDGRLLEALWAKARALKKKSQGQDLRQLELSLETLMVAVDLMDRNQELYQLEGSALIMSRDYYGVFENALDVCFELFRNTQQRKYLDNAFFLMEKSKARLLFDTFSDLQRNELLGMPDTLSATENYLISKLASFTRSLEDERATVPNNHQKIQELEDIVFQQTVELENFYQSLDSIYPSYATAVKSELQELSSIQHRLGKQERILVDYFWGDSTLFTMIIEEDGVNLSRQPTAPVLELVKRYQQHLLAGPQFTNQASRFSDFSNLAYMLYQNLLKGITLDDRPLIIAADGPLRFIPFEGLVVEKPALNLNNYDQLRYLVYYYPTSYVYSANLWALQSHKEIGKLQVLGFSHSALGIESSSELSNELPGTAAEIEVLKSKLEGLFFSGPTATKQEFITNAQEYDIIHLAIHGISDSVSRLNNRLLFRDPDDPGKSDPLYTYELYNLQLNSRLAVLSACESGIGRNYQGEGVYSMARAFSYAGCPTTVMSLWRIPDNTTPEILEQFYKQISRGKDIDYALQAAKLNYLSENQGTMAHPGLWAAMVVHGVPDKIVSERSWSVVIISMFMTLLLILVILKKR